MSDNNQQQTRTHMKTRTILLASLLAAAVAAPAFAAPAEGKAPTTQQQRMKHCNAEAKGKALKGDERRSFMSSCLKGHAAAAAAAGADQQAARQR
jgi:hypothetical protein